MFNGDLGDVDGMLFKLVAVTFFGGENVHFNDRSIRMRVMMAQCFLLQVGDLFKVLEDFLQFVNEFKLVLFRGANELNSVILSHDLEEVRKVLTVFLVLDE